MNRIVVLGCSGSGKSTFSQRLGARLGLPVRHLDAFFWKPGWRQVDAETFDATVRELAAEELWIIDGNYSRTLDLRLERADTVFLLDFPRYLCLYRVIKRRLQYSGRTRADMGEGCVEKLDFPFLRWVWQFRKRSRPKLLARLERFKDGREVVIFRSPREVREYWTALDGGQPTPSRTTPSR